MSISFYQVMKHAELIEMETHQHHSTEIGLCKKHDRMNIHTCIHCPKVSME